MDDRQFFMPDFLVGFIEEYRQQPNLWQVNAKGRFDKVQAQKSWTELTQFCRRRFPSADVTWVKKKVHNMKSSFSKELKKVKRSVMSGAGEDEIYTPKLWYYNLLLFTKDEVHPRTPLDVDFEDVDSGSPESADGNATSAGESGWEEASYEADDLADDPLSYPEQCFKEPQPPAAKKIRMAALTEPDMSIRMVGSAEPGMPIRMAGSAEPGMPIRMEPAVSDLLKSLTSAITSPPENDECSIAGKYIAQKLRQMSPQQQILAESIIQQVLSKGLRNRLTETTAILD